MPGSMTDTRDDRQTNDQAGADGPWFDAASPSLPEIIALQEKWRSNKPAVIFEADQVDWRRFGEATNRVAKGLAAAGLGPGDAVAVIMDNSVETLEVLIGAMKAGCMSAPLNLTISDAAMAMMIADLEPAAIIVSASQKARVDALTADADSAPKTFMIGVGVVAPSGGQSTDDDQRTDDDQWTDYETW